MRIVKPITITDSNLISSNVPENDAQVYSKLLGKNLKDRVMVLSNHTIYEVQKQETSAVTISQGSPATVTWNNHGLANGRMVTFSTSGTLPTGITAGTTYYVINAAQNTFQVSTKEPYFTRDSVGTYFDANGVLQTAPVNTLRVSYDPSDLTAPSNVVIEQAATNFIRNNTMQGAVAGSPGTKPSFWGFLDGVDGAVLGITANIVDLPIENGVPCIDIRYQGTASANGSLYIRFEFNEIVAAVAGQKWVAGFFYRMRPSASLPNSIRSFITERSAVPAHIQQSSGEALPISGQPLTQYEHELTITNANTAFIHSGVTMSFSAGLSYDFTVRIGLPHLCRDKLPRFPIKTGNGAVTRAADIVSDTPSFGPAVNTSTAGSGTHTALALVNNLDPVLNPTYWLKVGATNRWKMFDKAVQSQTVATGTLTTKIKPSERVDTLPLINLKGTTLNVLVTNPSYGTVINQTVPLLTDSEPVVDMSSYLYAGFTQRTEVVIEDIPPYSNNEITISLTSSDGSQVGIGAAVLGQARDISSTGLGVEQGARFGIDDYSIKTRDAFGNYVITERAFSDKANVTVFVNNSELSSIKNFLSANRATPMVFIGSKKYDYLTIYGFYKNWEVDVAYPDFSVLSMEISGLT